TPDRRALDSLARPRRLLGRRDELRRLVLAAHPAVAGRADRLPRAHDSHLSADAQPLTGHAAARQLYRQPGVAWPAIPQPGWRRAVVRDVRRRTVACCPGACAG